MYCPCRYNLLYYALLLAVGVAGLFLLLFARRLQPANVLGFCIASSNAYGLVAGGWRSLGKEVASYRIQLPAGAGVQARVPTLCCHCTRAVTSDAAYRPCTAPVPLLQA